MISVKVITNAKQNKIVDLGDGNFKIYLTCIAEKGRANEKLVELLSEYFDVSKSKVNIISGEKSHNKIIEIDMN